MIKLIEQYPYDNSYDFIKTFSSKDAQSSYFSSFNYTAINEHNYVKINQNTIRVPFSFEYITNNKINYLIMNNDGKKYYCFITKKNWISEEVCELEFEIDVIQTFMFDISCKSSFIERMNCDIEDVADFDEGLEIGEHSISKTMTSLNKEYNYFAMFGGIRQECITIDSNGNVKTVNQLNTTINTPMTNVDGIDYPLYFVPLKESYLEPNLVEVLP